MKQVSENIEQTHGVEVPKADDLVVEEDNMKETVQLNDKDTKYMVIQRPISSKSIKSTSTNRYGQTNTKKQQEYEQFRDEDDELQESQNRPDTI